MLPTLPEVALKVREAVDEPDATASQIADIVITDAALSTQLLKVANSALYRGTRAVESVQMAVSRLGQESCHKSGDGTNVPSLF